MFVRLGNTITVDHELGALGTGSGIAQSPRVQCSGTVALTLLSASLRMKALQWFLQ